MLCVLLSLPAFATLACATGRVDGVLGLSILLDNAAILINATSYTLPEGGVSRARSAARA